MSPRSKCDRARTATKLREILEELRMVLAGHSNLFDSLLPPLLFVVVNAAWDMQAASWTSLTLAVGIGLYRLLKRQFLFYALGGVGGIVIAILIAHLLGRVEGFFLPGIISGALTFLLCLISVIFGRPIVAWTSYIARRWPLDWYWHPKVRPAYSEVTWLWVVVFGLRLLLEFSLFQREATGQLAVFKVVTGWPVTIVLLIISYLYGTRRLRTLGGPSVEEFRAGAALSIVVVSSLPSLIPRLSSPHPV